MTIRDVLCIQEEGDTIVSRARVAVCQRYPLPTGARTIVRIVLNVLVRCIMRMGDVVD